MTRTPETWTPHPTGQRFGRREFLSAGAALGAAVALAPGVSAARPPSGRIRRSGPVQVWLAPNTVKTMRDDAPAAGATAIALSAARNEYETAQVLLRADADTTVTVDVSDLHGPAGGIAAPALSQQHYIEVTEPENTKYPAGWYPDALVPLDAPATLALPAGEDQGVWLKLKVPADSRPGDYRGELRIRSERPGAAGVRIRVPILLTVRDFALPVATSHPTAFTIWYSQVAWAFGVAPGTAEYRALMDKFYWFQVDQRLFPDDLPFGASQDPAEWVALAEPYLSDPRVSYFRIPYYGGDILGKTKELVGLLRDKGLLHKGFFYLGGLIDEPKPGDYDRVRQLNAQIKEIAPEVPNVVTTTPVEALADSVQTWCVPFNHALGSQPMTDWVRRAGKHAWWYPLVHIHWPLPSVFIDDSLLGTRLIPWLQRALGFEGLLYWATTIFEKWNGHEYVPRDTWHDPTGYPGTNGDGFLMYPGNAVGIDGPVGTVRMEALREGVEDLEYLTLWDARIAETMGRLGVQDALDPAEVTQPVFSRLYNALDDYTDDPQRLVDARAEVAEQISALPGDVPALVAVPDATERRVSVDVYARPGTEVVVNGRRAAYRRRAGAAQVQRATLDLRAGVRELRVELRHGRARGRQRRLVLVTPPPPRLRTIPVNDFETDADIARMQLSHVSAARSGQHATSGQSSVELTYQAGVSWPGVHFDAAADLGGTDWSAHRYLAFDLFSTAEGVPTVLYAKFHGEDGSSDDFHPVWLNSQSETRVRIDLRRVVIDRSAIARLELYGYESDQPVTVYLDNLRFLDVM